MITTYQHRFAKYEFCPNHFCPLFLTGKSVTHQHLKGIRMPTSHLDGKLHGGSHLELQLTND